MTEKAKGGICFFPSPFIFWRKPNNHEEIKSKVLPMIETDLYKNKETYLKMSNWGCDMVSSFHCYDENISTINNDLSTHPELVDAIWVAFNEMLNTLADQNRIDDLDFNYFIKSELVDIWYNKYDTGHYQDIHEHRPYEFSGIYILDDPNYSNTYFFDQNSIFTVEGKHTFGESESKEFDIGEGNILLFPGALPHHVPPVKSSKITISFNIRVSTNWNEESS